jgi:hypothetical protein
LRWVRSAPAAAVVRRQLEVFIVHLLLGSVVAPGRGGHRGGGSCRGEGVAHRRMRGGGANVHREGRSQRCRFSSMSLRRDLMLASRASVKESRVRVGGGGRGGSGVRRRGSSSAMNSSGGISHDPVRMMCAPLSSSPNAATPFSPPWKEEGADSAGAASRSPSAGLRVGIAAMGEARGGGGGPPAGCSPSRYLVHPRGGASLGLRLPRLTCLPKAGNSGRPPPPWQR